MFPLTPSDITLVIDLVLAVCFVLVFALGGTRTWVRDSLGWVIFYYGLSVVALLGLIVYAIVFNQKVDEPVRLLVGAALGIALIWKTYRVVLERRGGRIAGDRTTLNGRITPMSMNFSQADAVKSATEISYKVQRVLRTLVQVGIPAFLSFALVLPLIIEALGLPVDSELRLWLLAVAAGITAVATAITRVMAIPAVNAWLIRIGLGSVPRKALIIEPSTSIRGATNVVVARDPKVERTDG